jgi:hypothetical protein
MASTEANNEQGNAGPSEAYEVVYLKDNVSVHPSPLANERISGRLKLIKQGQSVFLVRRVLDPLSCIASSLMQVATFLASCRSQAYRHRKCT